jgi:hypothetical protein
LAWKLTIPDMGACGDEVMDSSFFAGHSERGRFAGLTRFSCHLSLGRNRGLAEIRIYILQGSISVFSIHNGMKLGLKIGVMRTSHHGEQRNVGAALNLDML